MKFLVFSNKILIWYGHSIIVPHILHTYNLQQILQKNRVHLLKIQIEIHVQYERLTMNKIAARG